MRQYFSIKSLAIIKLAFFTPLLLSLCSGGSPTPKEVKSETELDVARAAAKAFCSKFNFPADKISELDGPPLFQPTPLQREGREVVSYRWLGGGRGDYYVQVEIYQDNGQVVVYGGYAHQEFGPWTFDRNP
jgi:hypothetical protein